MLGPLVDSVRDAVVLDNVGVIYRHQVCPGVEVPHGVPALGHHAVHEVVSGSGRLFRLIDEALLGRAPFAGVARPGGLGKRLDVEPGVLSLPAAEIGLSGALTVARIQSPVVLGAEPLAQHHRPAPARCHHGGQGDGHQYHDDHDPQPASHRILP